MTHQFDNSSLGLDDSVRLLSTNISSVLQLHCVHIRFDVVNRNPADAITSAIASNHVSLCLAPLSVWSMGSWRRALLYTELVVQWTPRIGYATSSKQADNLYNIFHYSCNLSRSAIDRFIEISNNVRVERSSGVQNLTELYTVE